MSVAIQQSPRLSVSTPAGPLEVVSAASIAAGAASDVFSSEIREDSCDATQVRFLVTSPLARTASMLIRVSWTAQSVGLLVGVDVEPLGSEPCADRARRTSLAVDRFVEVLEAQLLR